jgi:hypothetical protein
LSFFVQYKPEAMETEDAAQVSTSTALPTLTSLDKTQDNFESLLLLLLQAYTTQHYPGNPSILGGAPISGEALDTLSSEQITALITSNSVNYEVIQQILAQQKGRAGRLGSPLQDQSNTLNLNSLGEEMEDSMRSPTSLRSPVAGGATDATPQLVQITPQQLQVLQSQVNELLQSQHITLPADLSPEQQQQLIQTLLLRQLQMQQMGGAISVKDASASMNQLKQIQSEASTAVAESSKESEQASGIASSTGGKTKDVVQGKAAAQVKKVRVGLMGVGGEGRVEGGRGQRRGREERERGGLRRGRGGVGESGEVEKRERGEGRVGKRERGEGGEEGEREGGEKGEREEGVERGGGGGWRRGREEEGEGRVGKREGGEGG